MRIGEALRWLPVRENNARLSAISDSSDRMRTSIARRALFSTAPNFITRQMNKSFDSRFYDHSLASPLYSPSSLVACCPVRSEALTLRVLSVKKESLPVLLYRAGTA